MPTTPDPNKERNDPMVAEFWTLGEDLQDTIRSAGFEPPEVEGIAVDVHDLLQASELVRTTLAPSVVASPNSDLLTHLAALQAELAHIRWHCDSADAYLTQAIQQLATQPPSYPVT